MWDRDVIDIQMCTNREEEDLDIQGTYMDYSKIKDLLIDPDIISLLLFLELAGYPIVVKKVVHFTDLGKENMELKFKIKKHGNGYDVVQLFSDSEIIEDADYEEVEEEDTNV